MNSIEDYKTMKKELTDREKLLAIRNSTGMNRKQFAENFNIPYMSLSDWERGKGRVPAYLPRLLAYYVRMHKLTNSTEQDKNINIITDLDGSKIVLIHDIRFRSRRGIDWNDVESILKEYIGHYYEIAETSEKIFVGTDFPDEFSHSEDTQRLKGANIKAKANMVSVIGEMIQIATNKAEYPDYDRKHGSKAEYGWYRYNTRFGLPIYDENGELKGYNIYSTRMLVRCAKDGKLYLYDFVRTKKETSKPLEQ